MKNSIELYQELLPDKFSTLRELDIAEFNGKKFQALGADFNSRGFEYIRFKNGQYENCTFNKCVFKSVGLSGTHFLKTELNDCTITDSNLQFCEFSKNSKIQGMDKIVLIDSSNLSHSMFHNSILQKIKFRSTTISQARFINIHIQDVIWESCTLQDNVFDNVHIENISLVGCNLEYSEFKNVHMKKVSLPLHQLPYTFGLLNCLKHYQNEISITAVSSKHRPLTTNEYFDLLPELFTYYTEMNEYFPAINIALFRKDYERAGELLHVGTQYYIQKNDFRKLKAICKLIADNSFYDKHYKTLLYYKLVKYYDIISVSEYEKYQYCLHINDIKELLTGFNDEAVIQLYLKTNITTENSEKIGLFYKIIEECLRDYGVSDEEYSIEIRHNSNPLSFWLMISQSSLGNILHATGILMSIITDNPSVLKTAIEVMANIATIGDFITQIIQAGRCNKKTAISDSSDIAATDCDYINKKTQLIKNQKISIELALPFFKFNYQKELQCKEQN